MGRFPPDRDEVISMVSRIMYSNKILNNAHRGDIVEMMVLSALGSDWRMVSLGWHPWDFQRGTGPQRIRIQVKQCAALQLWGPTKKLSVQFGWKKKAPDDFARYNPGEAIESEGWFCDIFVIGLHLVSDKSADQVDPKQWEFLVIPTTDLNHGRNSMVLSKALSKWKPVKWEDLRATVEQTIDAMAE